MAKLLIRMFLVLTHSQEGQVTRFPLCVALMCLCCTQHMYLFNTPLRLPAQQSEICNSVSKDIIRVHIEFGNSILIRT
jgi:hypothetical protein